MLKKITSLILAGAIAVSLTACSSSKEEVPVEKEEIKIVTTSFPLFDITRQIVKDKASVEMISYEYIEDYQYSAKDVNKFNDANIIIYSGSSFEPWVEAALEDENFTNDEVMLVNAAANVMPGNEILNYADNAEALSTNESFKTTKKEPSISSDFAYWLNLNNAKKIATTIQEHISNYDYENEAAYKESATNLINSFSNLDERYKVLTNKTEKSIVVVGSFNYYHLANYLNLKVVSAYDGRINTETTVSIKRLSSIIDFINNNNIKYIVSDERCKYAEEAIASDIKANVLNINDMSYIDKSTINDEGMTYYDIMEANYAVLKMCLY